MNPDAQGTTNKINLWKKSLSLSP